MDDHILLPYNIPLINPTFSISFPTSRLIPAFRTLLHPFPPHHSASQYSVADFPGRSRSGEGKIHAENHQFCGIHWTADDEWTGDGGGDRINGGRGRTRALPEGGETGEQAGPEREPMLEGAVPERGTVPTDAMGRI